MCNRKKIFTFNCEILGDNILKELYFNDIVPYKYPKELLKSEYKKFDINIISSELLLFKKTNNHFNENVSCLLVALDDNNFNSNLYPLLELSVPIIIFANKINSELIKEIVLDLEQGIIIFVSSDLNSLLDNGSKDISSILNAINLLKKTKHF